MSQDKRLYGLAEVWDQPLQAGQRNLLQAIMDFWPAGIGSVLDVGCGDGKLTRCLQALGPLNLVGLDSSPQALSRLSFEGVLGDAQALPFASSSFDLVMSTDALEHMPDVQETAAWQELFRVAGKAVMVAVPFREQLLDATARCPACGHAYHVNWHQRSYDFVDLHRRCPPGWSVSATVLAGEPWSPMLAPETQLRRQLFNEWAGWELAVCPACGAGGQVAPVLQALPSLFAQVLAEQIYPALARQRYCRSHSEVLVIFERDGGALPEPAPRLLKPRRQTACAVDFARQRALSDLRPFCQVAQHVASENGQWRIQFPLYQSAPALEVRRLPGSQGDLHMVLEDEAGWLLDGCVLEDGEQRRVHQLPRPPVAGYYGVLASCPMHEPFAWLQLGQAPVVLWAEAAEDQACRYLQLAAEAGPVFVQVAQPLWFDPQTLDQRPPTSGPSPNDVLAGLQARFERLVAGALPSPYATELNVLRVQVQNLTAERDALLKRAAQADRLLVIEQNLTAEREALHVALQDAQHQVGQALHEKQQLDNQLRADQLRLEALNSALTSLVVDKKYRNSPA
ncbi:methyltransferase domain-containing protein [Pseudomonas sp. 21LCFQ010]|uniref:class I SAM-dependent methyltransferase n=1 Tax=Pseudomonas sp. 21LCFQ010 TaxID=2957506 RepID=UPI002097A8B0|nr:methyltransferase domain-containing protein [Pseudomonas sp. 21LCFQ010]MCO8162105.1 methyltransferase domain-containing protein [Pseudomonas sp. 21LCFQ010]